MGRAIRRILVRTVRFFLVRPVALLAGAAALLALLAALVLLPSVLAGTGAPSISLGLPRPVSEPKATGDYLRGNRDYDAELIWGSLSDEARQRFSSQGGSVDDITRQVMTARERGVKLEDVSYIGGKALPDGTSMQFYLVAVRPQPKADVEYVPYMFTLDRDGKIEKVQ